MPHKSSWDQVAADSEPKMYDDPITKTSYMTCLGKYRCQRCRTTTSWVPVITDYNEKCEICGDLDTAGLKALRTKQREQSTQEILREKLEKENSQTKASRFDLIAQNNNKPKKKKKKSRRQTAQATSC